MIIVTGGAGMIGSNIVYALNSLGLKDIIIVDNLKDGRKIFNIKDLDFLDYIDKENFLELIKKDHKFGEIKVVFHEGACSKTTEWDGKYLMSNNYEYSKNLLDWSIDNKYQFINASSASVYGLGKNGFKENLKCEDPINPYAFSKFFFDQYIRKKLKTSKTQIVSLRYFNVYGPREAHKDQMASTIQHFHNEFKNDSKCKLFEGNDGYDNGEQMRDFVYVEDCVDVNLWFMNNPGKSGIFNVGTGKAETFNAVANNIIDWHKKNKNANKGFISYIPFPNHLLGSYQSYTKAEIQKLREVGYLKKFSSLKKGINKYLNWLDK